MGLLIMQKVKVGIVGCGNISEIYFKNFKSVFTITEVVACADILSKKANEKALEFGYKAMSIEEIMKDENIQIIVNLTIPSAHYDVCMKALH